MPIPVSLTAKRTSKSSALSVTSVIATETQPGRPMSGLRNLPRLLAAGGGQVVEAGGNVLGAIGVSGGPNGDADDSCALAGIKAIADAIEF